MESARMKIFVCIKQVPDTETKIKLLPNGSGIDEAGVKWVVNPYDEVAIEEALKLKDAFNNSTVTVLTVGPKARAVDALRTAMAMGADDAIIVDAPASTDGFFAAKAMAKVIQGEGGADLVLTGKLAIDDNASAVPQFLAEFLEIPHVTVVSKLAVTEKSLEAEREIEGGTKEVFELQLPALVAANKGLNMPRYASLPGIMKAKKKPLKEMTLADLGLGAENAKIGFSDFQLPSEKPAVKMIQGDAAQQAAELVKLLKDEAKVL
jgi:electron transfer flavoprotein beta subunit